VLYVAVVNRKTQKLKVSKWQTCSS